MKGAFTLNNKYLLTVLLFSLIALPVVLWLTIYRKVNPQVIVDNLHHMFDDVTFVSLDYDLKDTDLLGINSKVYSGVVHTKHLDNKSEYAFLANAYTGEIIEITEA